MTDTSAVEYSYDAGVLTGSAPSLKHPGMTIGLTIPCEGDDRALEIQFIYDAIRGVEPDIPEASIQILYFNARRSFPADSDALT